MPAVQQQPTRVFQDHAVTALFFQAVIYDTKGDRYLVVDVTNTDRGAVYTIANNLEHTIQISNANFTSFTKYRHSYQFPSLINRKTFSSWNAKHLNSKNKPSRTKFREQEFYRYTLQTLALLTQPNQMVVCTSEMLCLPSYNLRGTMTVTFLPLKSSSLGYG